MTTFTTHDGVELDYQDTGGDGFPLVMLHGWGQTKAMFRHQVAGLAASHRIIALDLRGHGLSSKPRFGYRIARFSRDVWELLDHLDLNRVDALGWSMGVSIWWSFIDQYGTGRLRKFIAVDQPSAVAAVPWMSPGEQAASGAIFDVAALVTLGESLHGSDGRATRDGFVRSMFSGDRTEPELLTFVMAELDTVPTYVGVPLLFDHCAQDWRDVLPRIDIDTLVIGCDGSHVDPSSQRYIADQIPHAQLHVFPADVASSHFPFLENPAEFNRVVEKFLSHS
jgi:pimeloyl-ACP methyl ester carboxylesterase